jgi:uncharacterized protein YacL
LIFLNNPIIIRVMLLRGGEIVGKKIAGIVVVFIFGLVGVILGDFLVNDVLAGSSIPDPRLWMVVVPGIALAGLGYKLSPFIVGGVASSVRYFVCLLQRMPIQDLIGGTLGLIIGLIIASFIGIYLSKVPFVGYIFSVILAVLLGYIGMLVGTNKKEDIFAGRNLFKSEIKEKSTLSQGKKNSEVPKVLDTSVIIDGRILDIVKTGFIEGPLVIPNFVLEELRHIADSSDVLKRNKGRRGLDILNLISEGKDIEVRIYEEDFPEIQEVDSKLVKLSQVLKGYIVTNDYNLNKVAQLQGLQVLNINDLANALKPVVIPGDTMTVEIVKEGKTGKQGIGYLDDGTMIVVEEGRDYLGKTMEVIVTSALQTSAGRMIFAKIDDGEV